MLSVYVCLIQLCICERRLLALEQLDKETTVALAVVVAQSRPIAAVEVGFIYIAMLLSYFHFY